MSLSCSCNEWDGEGEGHWYPEDYSVLDTKRRQRCPSCNALINVGALCAKFHRFRGPKTEVEERIYGEEIPLAAKYICETCADLYFSLKELGYCPGWWEEMRELAQEYAEEKVWEAEEKKRKAKQRLSIGGKNEIRDPNPGRSAGGQRPAESAE